jgi:hypothetical protein
MTQPYDLLEQVNDEQSFLRFLRALREDLETSERECHYPGHPGCAEAQHWESTSTRDFLRSMDEWGSEGDFGQGMHHGEPMLRRIAAMLYVGRFKARD